MSVCTSCFIITRKSLWLAPSVVLTNVETGPLLHRRTLRLP